MGDMDFSQEYTEEYELNDVLDFDISKYFPINYFENTPEGFGNTELHPNDFESSEFNIEYLRSQDFQATSITTTDLLTWNEDCQILNNELYGNNISSNIPNSIMSNLNILEHMHPKSLKSGGEFLESINGISSNDCHSGSKPLVDSDLSDCVGSDDDAIVSKLIDVRAELNEIRRDLQRLKENL